MNWHDDGEEGELKGQVGAGILLIVAVGLGPVVASLSLGSSAIMSWRPQISRSTHNTSYNHGQKSDKLEPIKPMTSLSITLSHGVSQITR
jgi:hypothetical protein